MNMKRNIHVDSYNRRKHGKATHGGKVKEHNKNITIADLRVMAKEAEAKQYPLFKDPLQWDSDDLEAVVWSRHNTATEQKAQADEWGFTNITKQDAQVMVDEMNRLWDKVGLHEGEFFDWKEESDMLRYVCTLRGKGYNTYNAYSDSDGWHIVYTKKKLRKAEEVK